MLGNKTYASMPSFYRAAVEADRALSLSTQNAGDHGDKGTLTTARRTENRYGPTSFCNKRDILKNGRIAMFRIGISTMLQFQHRPEYKAARGFGSTESEETEIELCFLLRNFRAYALTTVSSILKGVIAFRE